MSSSDKHHVEKPQNRHILRNKAPSLWEVVDQWVVLQLVAVFAFSLAAGLIFMHTTILWHQYKHGYGYWALPRENSRPSSYELLERAMHRFPKSYSDIYEWSHGQLRVNTTYYIR